MQITTFDQAWNVYIGNDREKSLRASLSIWKLARIVSCVAAGALLVIGSIFASKMSDSIADKFLITISLFAAVSPFARIYHYYDAKIEEINILTSQFDDLKKIQNPSTDTVKNKLIEIFNTYATPKDTNLENPNKNISKKTLQREDKIKILDYLWSVESRQLRFKTISIFLKTITNEDFEKFSIENPNSIVENIIDKFDEQCTFYNCSPIDRFIEETLSQKMKTDTPNNILFKVGDKSISIEQLSSQDCSSEVEECLKDIKINLKKPDQESFYTKIKNKITYCLNLISPSTSNAKPGDNRDPV